MVWLESPLNGLNAGTGRLCVGRCTIGFVLISTWCFNAMSIAAPAADEPAQATITAPAEDDLAGAPSIGYTGDARSPIRADETGEGES